MSSASDPGAHPPERSTSIARLLLIMAGALSVPLAAQGTSSPSPLQVIVLDGATGKPAAGATVWAVDASHPSRSVVADPFEPAPSRLARTGIAFRTDANGRVVLPATLDAVELGAVSAGRFAWANVTIPPLNPLVMTLQPDGIVLVHIVDRAGKPSPITASVTRLHPHGNSRAGWVRLRPDAQGRARLQTAQLLAQANDPAWYMRSGRLDAGIQLEVSLDVVAPAPIVATMEAQALPGEVRLEAPPCGELVVTVFDDAGKLVDKGSVHATVLTAAGATPAIGQSIGVVDGKARFPAVAVGHRLRVSMSTFGLTRGPVADVDGPKRPGEVAECTLRGTQPRGDGRPVLTLRGRIVDRRGLPRSDCDCCIGVWRGAGLLDELQPRTRSRSDGSFSVQLLGPLAEGDQLVFATNSGSSPRLDEVAIVARPLTDGPLDVGDVTPVPAPLLCDVRFVDADGKPAYVPAHVSGGGLDRWVLPGNSTSPDRNGRIVAHAVRPAKAQLGVHVMQQGCAMQPPTHFIAGSKDVVITLARTHIVPGRVLLPQPRTAAMLTVRLVPADTYGKPICGLGAVMPVSGSIAVDGSFHAGPATPGLYHLQILLTDVVEIELVENVTITADGVVAPERLQGIDLRSALREVTFDVDSAPAGSRPRVDLRFESTDGTASGARTFAAGIGDRPVQLFVPTGDWQVRATIGDRQGPWARVEGATVLVKLPD